MVMTQIKPDGLNGLCTLEQLQLFGAIDSLRSLGINRDISLPQIIVCGEQSSGKSSVLEGISGVPFPVNANVCTRFPTELVLRKTAVSGLKVSIVPRDSHGEFVRAILDDFHEELACFEDLPMVIEKAQSAMGIVISGKAFSRNVLRIEISGPDRPNLTIVDLPGLIQTQYEPQPTLDIELVEDVVQCYMNNPSSVILAIVSAENDLAYDLVLKLAQASDPKGYRTLGVITKPDKLHPGSLREKKYISLARNQEIDLKLGWHVLRNADSKAEIWALPRRDKEEARFLSEGSWSSLPQSALGVETLRDRLSKVLFRPIAAELPGLIEGIQSKLVFYQDQLDKLGQPRNSVNDQRMYLFQVGQSFQALTKAAIDGTYNDPFFGDIMSPSGYQKRFRAVVQNLNDEFAAELGSHGQRDQIALNSEDLNGKTGRNLLTRDQFIGKIIRMMKRSRGRELPGLFNPMIVSDLFKEQSSPWGDITRAHVRKVWNAARDFLKHLTQHAYGTSMFNAMMETVVEPRLDAFLISLTEKTAGLLKQHQECHPITNNHLLAETLQKVRFERQTSQITDTIKEFFGSTSLQPGTQVSVSLDVGSLHSQLLKLVEPDMSYYTASSALDYLEAYYEVALKRFIDDVAVEVIETTLVSELSDILTPFTVAMMPESKVTQIAGETDESREAREILQRDLDTLNSGLKTCKKHLGFQFSDTSEEGDQALSITSTVRSFEPNKGVDPPETARLQVANSFDSGSDATRLPESETEPIPKRDLVLSKENVLDNNTAKVKIPTSPPPALEEQYEAIRKWKPKPKPAQKEALVELVRSLDDDNVPASQAKQKKQKKKENTGEAEETEKERKKGKNQVTL